MHRGHDHDHHHHGNGAAGAGHNHAQPQRAVQWQTPHLPPDHAHHDHGEPDLDLVEVAFVDGFSVSKDPTSFLRLACIPFEAVDAEGRKLVLLRAETEAVADVGTVTPQLGGGGLRYDPLPARMVTRRRRLRFVYFDGGATRMLTLGEVRELKES